MCAKYELIYHKGLNMFNCFCRYFELFHHCTRKIKGTLSIVSCPEGCKLCEKELDRKEYNSLRWKRNEDGYSVCETCYCEFVKIAFVFRVIHLSMKSVFVQSS